MIMRSKPIWFLLLILLSVQTAFAQSASERRAAKLKAEKTQQDFNMDDPMFKKKEIPEEWKDRSAIIIGERIEYTYGIKTGYDYEAKIRQQLLLQDQSAVEDYGSFEFDDLENNRTGIQIIKPNGDVVSVDMSEAVGVDEENVQRSGGFFSSYERRSFKKKKIALSGLEIGDIIDFVVVMKDDLNSLFLPSCSYMVTVPFKDEYPIMAKSLQFTVKRGFLVSSVSLNGAPQLKMVSDQTSGRIQTYLATIEMVSDDDGTGYIFDHKVVPQIKFQVCQGNPKKPGDEFVGGIGEVKRRVTDAEIQTAMWQAQMWRVNNRYVSAGKVTYIRYGLSGKNIAALVVPWLKRNFRGVTDPIKLMDAAYYKIRHEFFFGGYQGKSIDDELFAAAMLEIAKQMKVPANLLVAPPKDRAERKDVIAKGELYWLVEIGTGSKKKLYYPLSMHRIPEDGFWRLDGVEAQIIDLKVKKAKPEFRAKKVKLPESPAAKNTMEFVSEVKLLEDNNLDMQTTYTYGGQAKFGAYGLALAYEDLKKRDVEWVSKYAPNVQEKASDKRRSRKEDAIKDFDIEENARRKKELLENRLKRMYNLVEFKSFDLTSDGRTDKANKLIYKQAYVISDIVTRAGNNLVLEAGKLLGEFSKIDTSKARTYDIMYDFPMSVNWTYSIEIPAGYQVEGIESLQMNVDNQTGLFKSTAVVEGNQLVFKIERSYKQNYMPVSSWNDFVTFVNAGNELSQRKVILKKM
jgi:hypothetical protein